MARVAAALDFDTNAHLQAAFALSSQTSNLTPSILEQVYRNFAVNFTRDAIVRFVDVQIGRDVLEGWVATDLGGGRTLKVRAFGARGVHVIAGQLAGHRLHDHPADRAHALRHPDQAALQRFR